MDLSKWNLESFGDGHPFSDPSWYQGAYSPHYNDTHKKLRAWVRDIFEEHIMPYVTEWDEAKEIPKEIYKLAGEKGFNTIALGHPYPTHYGKVPEPLIGQKIDVFHEFIVADELARCGSGGVLWGISGGLTIGLPPVLRFGSKALQDEIMPSCLSGDKMICLAITEPTAGSDVAQIRTSAKKTEDGKHYIVNGEKKWITNGIWADYFTVGVRTGGPGAKGISMLVVPRTEGVKTRRMNCSGVWASGTSYVTFEDVKVPVGNLLGKENKGFRLIMSNFNHERLMICAMSNRFSRTCLEESIKFANKRKTFGKRLVEHPVIRWKIGEMARSVEATHCWIENLLFQMQKMEKVEADLKLGGMTALCKVQCTKTFEYCARESAQIFGGLSYSRGGQGAKVERLNREVRAMAIPGGSEEIMLDLGVRQSNKVAEMAKKMMPAASKM